MEKKCMENSITQFEKKKSKDISEEMSVLNINGESSGKSEEEIIKVGVIK